MRGFLHMLSRVVVAIAILATGVAFVVVSTSVYGWETGMHWLDSQKWMSIWIGVGMVSLVTLYMFSGVPLRRREKFLSFDNDGGVVSISADAISDYVEKLKEEFPSVAKMRVMVLPRRGAVDLQVNVRVRSGSQVHEMCELLQQRVRESMVNGLGISQVRRVEVSVREIVSEHKPK